MTIGELVMLLKFQVDDASLVALDKRLDSLIAKAKGVAGAFKDAGLVVSGGGGGRGGSSSGGNGRLSGVQDRSHVDLWRWNQRNESEKRKDADKLEADKKRQFTQQLHWQRRLVEVSTKVALGLTALNAGMLAVVETGRRAAVSLNAFGLNTGVSPQTLQAFQQVGSRYDVTPDSMANALQALAKVRRDAQWGIADWGALNNLGLDPFQSPEKMLVALQARGSRFNQMDGANQTAFLARLGLDSNIQQFLARTQGNLGSEVGAVDKSLLLNGEGQKRIMAMDTAFNIMRQDLRNLGLQFADFASRYLKPVWETFDSGIKKLTHFFTWLNSGAEGADTLRAALYGLATALGAVTLAMSALSAASTLGLLAKLAGSLGGNSLAGTLAGGGALLGRAGQIGLVAGAGIGAYSLGSYFGLGKVGENISSWFSKLTHIGPREDDFHPPGWTPSVSQMQQTNHVTVHVDGGNPKAITAHLEDYFTGKIRTATANMPQFAPP